MAKRKLPNSVRKFIRREKGRIRRQFSDPRQQEEFIKELLIKFQPVKTKIVP